MQQRRKNETKNIPNCYAGKMLLMHKGYISMDYILNGLEYNAMLRV